MTIGSIIEVRGVKVAAKFYQKLPPHIIENANIFPAPQINSYVKTNVGLDTIICQIVGEHLEKNDNGISDHIVDLEVRGRVSQNQFLGGLRLLPIVGAKIETLSESEYNSVFLKPEYSICIGNNLYDTSNKIYLDVNTLIPSHIGIFGNTGSGKSNTLTKIISEYIQMKKTYPNHLKSRIIIFDLNNEYDGNAISEMSDKKIFRLSTKSSQNINEEDKIPINYKKLSYEDLGTILSATEKTQLPVIKRAYENSNKTYEDGEAHYGIWLIKKILLNKKSNLFFAIRQYGDNYIKGLDNFTYNSTTNAFRYGINTYIDNIDKLNALPPDCIKIEIPDNWLDRFELELILEVAQRSESGINFEYISPLMSRMASKKKDLRKVFKEVDIDKFYDNWFDDKSLAIIELANVNKDIRMIVPSLMSGIIYDRMVDEKGKDEVKSIINIVIDEAHNLLSNDLENTEIHSNTLKTFEKIIKEGRKYGVFLMLSSQRPSDISNTITSQLHNYFIHKLVNPNDIEKIRKTVAYMGESNLNMITVLGAGECIISGTSLYMPQYVYVHELDNQFKPNSANAVLFGDNGIIGK